MRGSERQVHAEGALVELGDDRSFEFIAAIEETDAERGAHILEDPGVLRPSDPRTIALMVR